MVLGLVVLLGLSVVLFGLFVVLVFCAGGDGGGVQPAAKIVSKTSIQNRFTGFSFWERKLTGLWCVDPDAHDMAFP